jgi:hypothetical protein
VAGGSGVLPDGFDIESGRGVDEALSKCGRGKAAGRWFDSAPSECGRATDGGARSGGNRPDGRRWLGWEVEDGLGRWAKRAGSAKWAGLAVGLANRFRAKNKDLNRWASDLIF